MLQVKKAVDPGQAGTLVLADAAPCVLAAVVTAVKVAAAVTAATQTAQGKPPLVLKVRVPTVVVMVEAPTKGPSDKPQPCWLPQSGRCCSSAASAL